jgi:small-conductance mechanosensitive channel
MLAFAFIFGNSVRNVFECVVWLFVVHPYDVGDTLVLNGENHRVSGQLGAWAGGRASERAGGRVGGWALV